MAVVELDRPEGMLRDTEPLLKLMDVPFYEHHHPRGRALHVAEYVVVIGLKNVRDLLKGVLGASIHPDGHVSRLRPELHRLERLPVRAAIGTGAAGALGSIDRAVLLLALKVHEPSHGAGDCPVLVPDEAANDALVLEFHRDVRVFVAHGKNTRVQAVPDILGILTGSFLLRIFRGIYVRLTTRSSRS